MQKKLPFQSQLTKESDRANKGVLIKSYIKADVTDNLTCFLNVVQFLLDGKEPHTPLAKRK